MSEGVREKIEGKLLMLSYKHDNEITLAIDDIVQLIQTSNRDAVRGFAGWLDNNTENILQDDHGITFLRNFSDCSKEYLSSLTEDKQSERSKGEV